MIWEEGCLIETNGMREREREKKKERERESVLSTRPNDKADDYDF